MSNANPVPKALEHERRLLATLIEYYTRASAELTTLRQEHFFSPLNAKIFQTITDLAESGKPVEITTVTSEGNRRGITATQISDLTLDNLPSVAYVKQDEAAILEAYRLRTLQEALQNTTRRIAEHATSEEIGEDLLKILHRVGNTLGGGFKPVSEHAHAYCEDLSQRFDNPGKLAGIPTGFEILDRLTGGLHPGHLVIIGARPSHGKTAFALTMARNMVKAGTPVGFVSLEMTGVELVERLVAQAANLNSLELRQSQIPEKAFKQAIRTGSGLIKEHFPLFIDDSAQANALSILSRARLLIRSQGVKALFVDYLQLTDTGKREETRNQEISKITRALKQFAQSENIPVIVLSQLSRRSEGRTPILGDLRDSGAIEQDANLVLFIYRPEYEGRETMPDGRTPAENMAEISVAKQRNGPTGKFLMWYQHETTAFKNFTNSPSPNYPATGSGRRNEEKEPALPF